MNRATIKRRLTAILLIFSFAMLVIPGSAAETSAAARMAQAIPAAQTVSTKYVTVDDIRFAYREVGRGRPLVLLARFRGTMDNWDPKFIALLARHHRVILFDNVGVGLTNGTVPTTISAMAEDSARFLNALGLTDVDVLGFSMGGMVAQALAVHHPTLVRRLVLAGTIPGGPGTRGGTQEAFVAITGELDVSEDLAAYKTAFFTPTPAGQAAAAASFRRLATIRHPAQVAADAWAIQGAATFDWIAGTDPAQAHLAEIRQPVLVANGDRDVVLPTFNSFLFLDLLPQAQLVTYPDAGHGFLYQYPAAFAKQVAAFTAE
jgi:pimeloyl-ACP methyl ester carboxylesterase